MALWTKHWEYLTRQIHYNGIMDQTLGILHQTNTL